MVVKYLNCRVAPLKIILMSFVVLDSDAAVPKNLDKRYLSEDKKTVKAEDRTIHCHKIRVR